MSRRGPIALAVVGVVAATLAARALFGDASSPNVTDAPALRCRFNAGETRSFRISVRSSEHGRVTGSLEGSLFLRTVAPASGPAGMARVAGLIVPDEDPTSSLRSPFVMQVTTRCRFEGFAFAEGESDANADAIEATLRLFEIVGPDRSGPRWSASQHDLNGTFFAEYARTTWDAPSLGLTRRVSGYRDEDTFGSALRMVHNELEGVFDVESGFVASLEGDVRHRIEGVGRPMELRIEYTLARSEAPPPAELTNDEVFAGFVRRRPRTSAQRTESTHAEPAREDVLALTPEAACERALALWDATENPAHDEAYQFLLEWVRGRPDAAASLVDAIREGTLDEALHALAFLVLGTADTEGSRLALVEALADVRLSSMNRERAALSLGTNTTPTLASFDGLRTVADSSRRAASERSVRDVAMRSLGAFARDEAPEEVRERAREYVRSLASSANPSRRLAGLDAVGNAGADALFDAVEPAFEDPDATVRASAFHALRDMPTARVQPVVADALAQETNDAVRRSLLEAAYTNAQRGAHPVISNELGVATRLTHVGIDNAGPRPSGVLGGSARTLLVEGSAESAERGFVTLGTFEAAQDGETLIDVRDATPMRWLRFTVRASHIDAARSTYFDEVIARGTQASPAADERFTGVFETAPRAFVEIKQSGSTIMGCFVEQAGNAFGEIEGEVVDGVARLRWRRTGVEGVGGVALLVIDSGGRLSGVRYRSRSRSLWSGPRAAAGTTTPCSRATPPRNPIADALTRTGEARVYGILFDFDAATLRAQSDAALRQLLAALEATPTLRVTIEGHTDDVGADAYNLALSERRAQAVVAWLVQHGIGAARLVAVGRGEIEPVADNATADGRALNRRVEVTRL